MKILDAHTHIDYITCDYQHDVVGAVCCSTKESEWLNLENIIATNNCVYGAFGVHPWFVNDVTNDFDKRLENLLQTNPNYMVGEIGLDKHKPNMDKQIDVFIKQLDIAIKLHRNIFIHCVGAWDKMLYIFKQFKKYSCPIFVIHGFNENDDILSKLLKYENVYFSIGKNALYDRNCRIEQIPSNRILIESDGKSNVSLVDVLNKIIEIKHDKNMPDIIYNNTSKVLNNE